MDFVFPALERAFNGDPLLVLAGRKLFHGVLEEPRRVLNYVEVECLDVNFENEAFDSEEPIYQLRWVIKSKSPDPKDCAAIMGHLERIYHNQTLTSEHFTVSGMRFTTGSGPNIVAAMFVGERFMHLHTFRKTTRAAVKEGIHG